MILRRRRVVRREFSFPRLGRSHHIFLCLRWTSAYLHSVASCGCVLPIVGPAEDVSKPAAPLARQDASFQDDTAPCLHDILQNVGELSRDSHLAPSPAPACRQTPGDRSSFAPVWRSASPAPQSPRRSGQAERPRRPRCQRRMARPAPCVRPSSPSAVGRIGP
jgi:hypothetical protein